jgi:hypothetical protein
MALLVVHLLELRVAVVLAVLLEWLELRVQVAKVVAVVATVLVPQRVRVLPVVNREVVVAVAVHH